MKTGLTAFLILFFLNSRSQTFPVRGQLASTAFPVCGTAVFSQSVVPIGSTSGLTVPGCGRYADINPFWYSFTCYKSGTLGFRVAPRNLNDDYDWMLFDITGHPVNDVYKDGSLVITGNWAGTYGYTGAGPGGSSNIECASDPKDNINSFSIMPALTEGHQYLLLISHYTQTQSGYALTFGGGTAGINDPTMPTVKSAIVGCNKKIITVVTNKNVRCNSLAIDGSDFILNSGPIQIVGATGSNCSNSFDMDSIQLILNAPLTPGNYSVITKTGNDDNTLLDDCGSQISVGEKTDFTVLPNLPTPMDSLTTPACSPDILQLIFSDAIQCSSIAADGSDFLITGSSAVSITAAKGQCAGDLTKVINVILSAPITKGGSFQIGLRQGSDGSTIINECGEPTPAGASLPFTMKDTVSADFTYDIGLGCIYDTIAMHYLTANGINQWSWNIDSSFNSNRIDLSFVTAVFKPKSVQHIVSNGFCTDTAYKIIYLDNTLKAVIQSPDQVCPKDLISFSNSSVGHLVSSFWNFGDGSSSILQNPEPHLYPDTREGKKYLVSLVVTNDLGCSDTTTTQIAKLQSCVITVPNAFTPNGDNINDFLYPLNALSTTDLEFRVFNRYGQLVFETRDPARKWDGKINGLLQPTGSYIWMLSYMDGSGKKFFYRGSSMLIR